MEEKRFQELLEEYGDGNLDENASRELLEAFGEDASLKAQFVEELRLANSLRGLPLLEGDQISTDVCESIRLGKDAPDVSEAVLTELRSVNSRIVVFPFMRVATGLAAAIAIALLVISGGSTESLATVAQTIDATWSEGSALEDGASLGPGKLSLVSGVVRLDFAKGVRVTLQGPAELELLKPGETRLHSGTLTAHVPPEGIGFQVYTEKADITDLGTTFGVSVDSEGKTDVLVFEGEVEVASPTEKKNKGTIIREGNAMSVGSDSEELKPALFEPRSFDPGWEVLFGVLNTGGRIRFINAQLIGNPATVEDRENIVVFPERFGTLLKRTVQVTLSDPGKYGPEDLMEQEQPIDLNGREVNTYLLQYNPPQAQGDREKANVPFQGEITFDRPILAVITNSAQLRETDGRLGKRRFQYEDRLLRGLEHGDSLTLSEDRRTLSVDWLVMPALTHGTDQVRVIVDSSESINTP